MNLETAQIALYRSKTRFSLRESERIVGGRLRLQKLMDTGKIRVVNEPAKKNSSWLLPAAEVLNYAMAVRGIFLEINPLDYKSIAKQLHSKTYDKINFSGEIEFEKDNCGLTIKYTICRDVCSVTGTPGEVFYEVQNVELNILNYKATDEHNREIETDLDPRKLELLFY